MGSPELGQHVLCALPTGRKHILLPQWRQDRDTLLLPYSFLGQVWYLNSHIDCTVGSLVTGCPSQSTVQLLRVRMQLWGVQSSALLVTPLLSALSWRLLDWLRVKLAGEA